MSKLSGGSPSVKSKTVYRVKNWSSYNRALVPLRTQGLTVWLDDSLWKQWYAQGRPNGVLSLCIRIKRLNGS